MVLGGKTCLLYVLFSVTGTLGGAARKMGQSCNVAIENLKILCTSSCHWLEGRPMEKAVGPSNALFAGRASDASGPNVIT